MFLYRLNKKSKEAFSKLACCVVKSCEELSEEEKSFIDAYINEHNIDINTFKEDGFLLEECLKEITNKEDQKIILLELSCFTFKTDFFVVDSKKLEIFDTIGEAWDMVPRNSRSFSIWGQNLLPHYTKGQKILDMN